MNTEVLYALTFQDAEAFVHLLGRKAVLCIPRIVHNTVTHLKQSTRIIAAADRFRQLTDGIFQKLDMCNII